MSQQITAIYENGVFRPLTPLDLPDQQMVELQVTPQLTPMQEYLQQLSDSGIVTPPSGKPDKERQANTDREALANKFGEISTKPVSEIIIEERGR